MRECTFTDSNGNSCTFTFLGDAIVVTLSTWSDNRESIRAEHFELTLDEAERVADAVLVHARRVTK